MLVGDLAQRMGYYMNYYVNYVVGGVLVLYSIHYVLEGDYVYLGVLCCK